MSSINTIKLHEYAVTKVDRERLPVEAAELLKKKYGDKINVEMTSFGPDSDWQLTAQGWVGYIPLTPEVSLRLCPKKGVKIKNLFKMLEFAYSLESFHLLRKRAFRLRYYGRLL